MQLAKRISQIYMLRISNIRIADASIHFSDKGSCMRATFFPLGQIKGILFYLKRQDGNHLEFLFNIN